MSDATIEALIVDLLLWLGARERTYPEVLDAGARLARGFSSGKMRTLAGSFAGYTTTYESW